MLLLEAQQLTVLRGEEPLFAGVNLTLNSGEVLQIEGENGSGKTTLLRVLCGLIQPDDGDVLWKGQALRRQMAEFREQTLYLGHKAGVKHELTAHENLAVFLATNDSPVSGDEQIDPGLSTKEQSDAAISEALSQTGILHRAHLPCAVLSAGQRRRVALARLLLSTAHLWILDEPLTSLDGPGREFVRGTLERHVRRGGAILYSTHQAMTLDGCTTRAYRL